MTPVGRRAAAPGLVDALRAAVPARVAKRLDAGNPAEAWTWSADGATVTTDGGETVTIGAAPVSADGLRCTCLLSPRCLHVLAVAAALPSSTPVAAPGPGADPAPELAPIVEPKNSLDAGQRAAAGASSRAATAVLLTGATGVGATALADLLRAVHGSRSVGLHRLARAGERVRRHVRDLQGRRPSFELDALVDDLAELLVVARALSGAEAAPAWIGTARQAYSPVGTLRLYGLCAEPVVTATGAAGVSTLLCDGQGRLWTVSDVLPKQPVDRARATYDAAVALGGATLAHRELCRAGLFAQDATASPEGRIGTGGGIKAVRSGPSSWTDAGPASLFAAPLAAQLERGGPLFVAGALAGVADDALLLVVDGVPGPVRLVPPSDHRELAYRDNLRLLGRAPGLAVRVIGRAVPGRRAVAAIAIGPGDDGDGDLRFALPAAWAGRCNLGLDGLVSAHVAGLQREAVEVALEEEQRPDPLDPLRRRVARLALGGRGTLPGDARGAVDREIGALRAALMPAAGRALAQLADASAARTASGEGLATAWLAAAIYARAAKRSLDRAEWRVT